MRRRQLLPLLALTLAFGAVPARVSQAQWQVNGVPLCTAPSDQTQPAIASDGAGGAIVTWYENRNGNYDIYARRVNAAGEPQWTDNGVALCAEEHDQVLTDYSVTNHTIASDGAGGAIVTWIDFRNNNKDIYAQRVNAAGAPQWTANGVALCTFAADQRLPAIASDGAGGAIVTWHDTRHGPGGYVYAQRVDAAGAPQWTADGVALCPAVSGQGVPQIASDGAGGAIVTFDNADIYAQRVNAAGELQWGLGGVALCTAVGGQALQTIASDGAGGAIVAWVDERNGNLLDVYAQRVSAAGAPLWTENGVELCTTEGYKYSPRIVSDGAGGAIVTWDDGRGGALNYDIYAQRVSAAGAPQWTADGVALCAALNNQTYSSITEDGAGGAVVTWQDTRDAHADIYAQRVSAAGAPQWTSNGVALCTAGAGGAPTIVSDGAGGAIVTWVDTRSGNYDIYAQRVYGSGGVVAVPHPSAPAGFQILALSPNPTRDGQMTIRFNLPSSERASAEVFDLEGKRVRRLATDREFPAGTQALGWDGRNDAGVGLPSGVYFVKVRVGTHSEARRAVLLH